MNAEQKEVFDAICAAVDGRSSDRLFFIDAPGGSGKTFLSKAILAYVRSRGEVALATASSGIAALLPVERAPHAPKARCGGERDVKDFNVPFGGAVVVMLGDFRQTLPVVRRGSRAQQVKLSFRKHPLWGLFHVYHLRDNMRALGMRAQGLDPSEQVAWADYLLRVGDGADGDTLPLPAELHGGSTTEVGDILNHTFGDINDALANPESLINKAILTPKNVDVDAINLAAHLQCGGEDVEFLSRDKALEAEDNNTYPPEFLHSLKLPELPPHSLILKVGQPIMLMRNLNSAIGMANGTRLIITGLHKNVIVARIMTGRDSAIGRSVFIPRIDLTPSDADLPFTLCRRQFPIRQAFAMTINKSQGQTLDSCAIYLPNDVFSHGQLYVAMSRCRTKAGVKVYTSETSGAFVKNVVFHEILNTEGGGGAR
eukprot:CAMPEP_0182856208 /NCGR_PEP_ID=MMETSP0034_2-20130328/2297_1 /TAXON_ID=156128 /ORGANISM="Nephroselmis pyriformis, Strain CCMP717" /LENGTH=426 /DNA_ID=CAMNT_0024987257 /DNA_START=197 /DNA_END=1474 /DNA_ORIENTATION=+